MPERDRSELTEDDATGDLARRARGVLDANRRGTWTCPSADLYPHQWLWDSCFVAIGLARHDPARAADELRALFRGQWSNGMVPHMIFADDVRDVGSTRIWRSHENPLAPRDVETSCITHPPMLAVAAARVADALPPSARPAFVAEMLPKLVAHHEWLYRERDPDRRGLITLLHPWECGLDTTPPWMDAIGRMPKPWWASVVARLHLARALRLFRRDTRYVPTVQRPSDRDGLGMLVLIWLAAKHGFELRRMPRDGSVLIEDLAFNAILTAANRALEDLARGAGVALPDLLLASFERTRRAFDELWDEDTHQYCSRDAVTGLRLQSPTIATFLPLYAGVVPPARVAVLVDQLQEPSGYWPRFPVPTVPTTAAQFREQRYWKGPTWVNTNWLVIEGLRGAGDAERAAGLRDRTVDLVERAGFWEYFSPLSGRGYGAPSFSWTAGLTLDLLAAVPAP
jgi:glycogen debranching enzyme